MVQGPECQNNQDQNAFCAALASNNEYQLMNNSGQLHIFVLLPTLAPNLLRERQPDRYFKLIHKQARCECRLLVHPPASDGTETFR